MLSGFCPASSGVLFCSLVLGCRYTPETTGPSSQWCPVSSWGCVWVWHFSPSIRGSPVCFIRSGVTRFTLLMVLYLDRMCQCGLHAVLWSHIGTLMHSLAAEPCSTAGLLFPSRCPSGTVLLTPFFPRVSRVWPMLLYWPKLLYPYYSLLLFFPFSFFCL